MSESQHIQQGLDVNIVPEDVPFELSKSGEVVQLDERRAAREQAKADIAALPEIPDFNDPRVMEAWRMGVKAWERNEKRKVKKEGGGEGGGLAASGNEDSLQLRYAHHFFACEEIRIGGSAQGGRSVYEWDGREARWVVQSDDDARSHATLWMAKNAREKVDADLAKKCLKTALDLYAQTSAKRMPEPDPQHPILPVIGAYLRIGNDGLIRATHPDMNAGVTHRVAARLDWDRVDPETGIYTPRSLPADSKLAQYLNKFVPDLDVRNLLQESLGASLLPAGGWHKAFVLLGGNAETAKDGSNGKSTFLKLVEGLHPQKTAIDLTTLHSDPTQIADLESVSLAVAMDAPEHLGKQSEQRLKSIIAGDRIRGRSVYKDPRCFEAMLSIWIAMNGGGFRFHDRTPAMEERFLYLPFNVRVPRDSADNIKNFHLHILEDEEQLGVLLDWALEGVSRLCRNGKRFSVKPACILAADEARRIETDPTYAWLVESCMEMNNAKETTKSSIYALYKKNLLDGGAYPLGEAQFWRVCRGFVETRGGKFQERQPSAPRHLPRPGRTVNLTMQGLAEMDYRWGNAPVNAPSDEVFHSQRQNYEPLF